MSHVINTQENPKRGKRILCTKCEQSKWCSCMLTPWIRKWLGWEAGFLTPRQLFILNKNIKAALWFLLPFFMLWTQRLFFYFRKRPSSWSQISLTNQSKSRLVSNFPLSRLEKQSIHMTWEPGCCVDIFVHYEISKQVYHPPSTGTHQCCWTLTQVGIVRFSVHSMNTGGFAGIVWPEDPNRIVTTLLIGLIPSAFKTVK